MILSFFVLKINSFSDYESHTAYLISIYYSLYEGEKFQEVWNPVLLGTVYGIIGKMQILPGIAFVFSILLSNGFSNC